MEKTFLDVTDISFTIKCTYWHITFELGIWKHFWNLHAICFKMRPNNAMFG